MRVIAVGVAAAMVATIVVGKRSGMVGVSCFE